MAATSSSPADAPAGLLYVPDLITPAEERATLDWLAASAAWQEVRFRGQLARRRVLSFGARYVTQGRRVEPAPPLPPELCGMRDRMVEGARARLGDELALAGRATADFAMCTVLRYAPGAGIGWHTDNAIFGPTVLAVSLGAPGRLQFRRDAPGDAGAGAADPGLAYELALAPRSLFVLAGESRAAWKHRLVPVERERYSVTVRALAELLCP